MTDTETGDRRDRETDRQETGVRRFGCDVDGTVPSVAGIAALSELPEQRTIEPPHTRVDADTLGTPPGIAFSMWGHKVGLDGGSRVSITPSGDNRGVGV